MKKASQMWYAVRQGVKNIRRNRMFSLASIGTMMACLFLFGIFYFVLSNFQYMIKSAESSVGVTVFFEKGLDQDGITEIGGKLRERQEVSGIRFVSAEEAWEQFKKQVFQGKEELADTFAGDNPLVDSASYEVYLTDISRQEELVRYVEGLSGVRQVNSSREMAKGLGSFNTLVGYVSAVILIILLSVAVFLISTTVTMGISVRKEEISIMRLLGATDFFIRAPFIVEGVIIGLTGAVLPLFILHFLYNRVVLYIAEKFSVLTGVLEFLDVRTVFSSLIPISLMIGVGIGFFGSFLTVRKHLRKK